MPVYCFFYLERCHPTMPVYCFYDLRPGLWGHRQSVAHTLYDGQFCSGNRLGGIDPALDGNERVGVAVYYQRRGFH